MEMFFTHQNKQVPQRLNKGATIRGVLVSLAINTIPSFLLFEVCKLIFHTSDMTALLISSIPVIIYSLASIVRQKHIDLFSGFMIVVIAVGIGILLLGGSPRLYLLRESLISIVIGAAYLVSLLFPKPLWFYVGRYFLTGNDAENIKQFNTRWHYPFFRFAMRLMTFVWGALTLLMVAIHIVLVFTLPIALLLLTGPILTTALWVTLLGWTSWYVRRLTGKLREVSKEDFTLVGQNSM